MNDTNSFYQSDPFDEPLEPQKADRLILNDTFLLPPVAQSLWTGWITLS